MDDTMAMESIERVIEKYGRELLDDPDRLQQLLEAEGQEGRRWFFPFVLALRTAHEMGYRLPFDASAGSLVAEAMRDRFCVDEDIAPWAASAVVLLSRRFYGASSEARRPKGCVGSGGSRGGRLTPSQVLWVAIGVLWLFAALSFGIYRMMVDRRPDGGEFRLTLLAPLSGSRSPVGQAMLMAAQMAVDQVNSHGGVKGYRVRLMGFDGHSRDAVDAAQIGDRLKARTRPHVVLCAAGDQVALGLVRWSQDTRTPVVAVDSKDPLVPSVSPYKPNPFVFALLAPPSLEGRMAAYFVRQGLERYNAFVVFDGGSRRSVEAERRFEASFPAVGGQVEGRLDLSAAREGLSQALAQLPKDRSCALVAFLSGVRLEQMVRIARAGGFDGPAVALVDPYESVESLRGLSNTWLLADASPGDQYVQPFLRAYRERYKDQLPRELVVPAMLAYDAVLWATDAIARASSYSPEGIRYALADTRSLSLIHATLSIDPSTHAPENKAMALFYVGSHGPKFQRRIWMGPR